MFYVQANGLDERWNQTLQQMFVKFTLKKELWEDFWTPACLHTTLQDTTLLCMSIDTQY